MKFIGMAVVMLLGGACFAQAADDTTPLLDPGVSQQIAAILQDYESAHSVRLVITSETSVLQQGSGLLGSKTAGNTQASIRPYSRGQFFVQSAHQDDRGGHSSASSLSLCGLVTLFTQGSASTRTESALGATPLIFDFASDNLIRTTALEFEGSPCHPRGGASFMIRVTTEQTFKQALYPTHRVQSVRSYQCLAAEAVAGTGYFAAVMGQVLPVHCELAAGKENVAIGALDFIFLSDAGLYVPTDQHLTFGHKVRDDRQTQITDLEYGGDAN
ncbi:MAG TPA: hypothetical protein VMI92_07655 [Steroidobacteraceae bacterium]|nr:hypothetical protein [Steroidobacteraceae bacterium]